MENPIKNDIFQSVKDEEFEIETSEKLSKNSNFQNIINDYDITENIDNDEYYTKAQDYWSKISPTVDGMLGGFGKVTFVDIRGSILFLQKLFKIKPSPDKVYALDCGAGIGRVTKNLLIPFFEKIDMVEQDNNFCEKAREFVDDRKLGEIYNCGLQHFVPEKGKYDVIWSQWVNIFFEIIVQFCLFIWNLKVLGHLKDHHLVEFFKRCADGLKKNGVIVVKENFTTYDEVQVDTQDSSVTRPLKLMKQIFDDAGLRLISNEEKQTSMPKGLFPVYMMALRPKNRAT